MGVRGRYRAAAPLSTRGSVGSRRQSRSRHDLLDDGCLCVRVVLDELPLAGGEIPLRSLVEVAILIVGPEPVTKADHPLDLRRARREDVKVDVGVGTLEDSVLVPVRLADRQALASRLAVLAL